MQLELSDTERVALQHALKSYVSDLREEITKTEKKDWRIDMHSEEEALNRILARLS
jgi:hypothetical protein